LSTEEPENGTNRESEGAPEEPSASAPAEGTPEGEGESQSEEGGVAPAEEEAEQAPVAEEAVAEEPVAEEPVAEEPVAEEAVAEEPVAEEPAPAEEPAAEEPVAEEPALAEDSPAEESAPAAPPPAAQEEQEEELYEPTPRQKPEIPGADLEPVYIPREEDQYLDAEARAAAEAEAEAEAARAAAEAEADQALPIADAAIDLAAGARYTATGKRKTAVARVILRPGTGEYLINGKPLDTFFPRATLQRMIRLPLETVGYESRMDVVARMHGGGVSAQAGALRHGISRALIEADPNLRGELKRRGFLTRDPRVKERKKAGLKKARKRPQFSKR
jgi:small subunit ribosomal protein S9